MPGGTEMSRLYRHTGVKQVDEPARIGKPGDGVCPDCDGPARMVSFKTADALSYFDPPPAESEKVPRVTKHRPGGHALRPKKPWELCTGSYAIPARLVEEVDGGVEAEVAAQGDRQGR